MIRKYPGIFLLLFAVGGIVIADISHAQSWVFLLTALGAGLVGLLLLNRTTAAVSMLSLGVALGGIVAVHFALSTYDFGSRHLASLIDENRECHVFGTVSDWPELKTNLTEITVAVDSLGEGIERSTRGSILMKITDTSTALQIGDRIEFHARIYPVRPEDRSDGGFDYRRYLRMKGISGIVYLPTLLDVRIDRRYRYGFLALTDRIRSWITDSFRRNLPPDQAALASGFLIGETRDIPVNVYRQFRQSGTLHLLAVSGSNVALVLLVCLYLIRPFGLSRRRRGVALLGILLLFAVISYGQPSVIRASVMAGLVIIAGMLERRYDLNNIIALSAVIILLFDPGQFYDVGFQLSYATTWGIIFMVPRLTVLFHEQQNANWYRWIVFPVIVSLVAQIASTPLILLYFGEAPLLSVPANLIIVPLTGVAVVGVMILLIADLIWPILGLLAGSMVSLVLELLLLLVALFGSPDLPTLHIPPVNQQWIAAAAVILVYILVTLSVVAITKKYARRALLWIVIGGVLGGLLLGLRPSGGQEDTLRLTTIPGGVAAVRYRTGSDNADLILHGAGAREYSISGRILTPWLTRLGIERIDKCFVLGAEYNALGDLFSLHDSIPIQEFYLPQALRQSVTDVLSHSGRNHLVPGVRYLNSVESQTGIESGYCASPNGLRLVTPSGDIWFADNLLQLSAVPGGTAMPVFVVLASRTQVSPVGDTLSQAGARAIICADIAQPREGNRAVPARMPTSVRPDFWIDLRASGELVIRLSDTLVIDR